MKKWSLIVMTVAAVVVLAGCGSSTAGKVSNTVEIVSGNMTFAMKNVTVKKGETIRLVLNNQDQQVHDFTVDQFRGKVAGVQDSGGHGGGHGGGAKLHVSAAAGKSGTVDFMPSEAGTYDFYCTVPGHKEAGMVGTLTVQ